MTTGDDPGDWAAPGSSLPPPGWSTEQPPPAPVAPPWQPAAPAYQQWGPPYGPPSPRPGIVPLRPLSVGELLDGAFTAIRRYPRVTIGLSALVATVQQLISLGLDLSTGELSTPSTGLGQLGTVSGVLGAIVNFVLAAVLVGMLSVVIGEGVLGRPATLASVWGRVRPLFWPLVGAALLAAILPFLGLVALIVGGVFLWVALSFTTPALVLERLGVRQALRRSWRLAVPAFWRVLGVRLLALLIAGAIAFVLELPGIIVAFASVAGSLDSDSTAHLSLAAEAAIRLSALVATTVTAPFTAGVLALLYIDRRIRAEALDLALARAATESTSA